MEKTETEYEEKEVTRVYCDDCGSDCTDEYNDVKKQLCGGCTDWSTFERAASSMPRVIPQKSDDKRAHFSLLLCGIPAYPLILLLTLHGYVRRDSKIEEADRDLLLMHVVGTMVFTAMATLILVATL
jgi:hypothetical protein